MTRSILYLFRLSTAAAVALATWVGLELQAQSTYYPQHIEWGRHVDVPFFLDGSQYTLAGEMAMTFTGTVPTGYDDFFGFCCDVDNDIYLGENYYAAPVSGSQSGLPWVDQGFQRASYLYSTKWPTLGTGTDGNANATALQIAIWEVLYNGTRDGVSQTRVTFNDNVNDPVQHHIYQDVTSWVAEAWTADTSAYANQNTVWIANTQADGQGNRRQTLLGPNPVPEPGQVGLAVAILLVGWRGVMHYRKRQGKPRVLNS